MNRNNDNGNDGDDEWQEGFELTSREEEEALAIRADARQLLFDLGIGDYRMVEGDYNDWYASEERQLLWDVVDGNYDTSNLNREDGETASTEPLTLSSSSHNSSSSVFDFIEYYDKFIDSTLPSPLPTPPLPPPIPLITLPWDDPLPPMPPPCSSATTATAAAAAAAIIASSYSSANVASFHSSASTTAAAAAAIRSKKKKKNSSSL